MVRFFTRESNRKEDVEKNLMEEKSQLTANINPTEYPKNKPMCLLWIACAIVATVLPLMIWFGTFRLLFKPGKNYSELTEDEQSEKRKDNFMMLVNMFGWVVPYHFLFTFSVEYQHTANKMQHSSFVQLAFYCPFGIFFALGSLGHSTCFPWLMYTTPFLMVLQLIVVYIPIKYDLHGHFPIAKDQEKFKKIKFYEESTGEKKYLCVKESRAFRIVIENVGDKTISKIWIERFCSKGDSALKFVANFDLEEPLLPGKSIVIIPETHTEEGALKAFGYRSFGHDITRHLITSVSFHDPENETSFLSVQYNETYAYREDAGTTVIDDQK